MTREERDRLILDMMDAPMDGHCRSVLRRIIAALPVTDPAPVAGDAPLDITITGHGEIAVDLHGRHVRRMAAVANTDKQLVFRLKEPAIIDQLHVSGPVAMGGVPLCVGGADPAPVAETVPPDGTRADAPTNPGIPVWQPPPLPPMPAPVRELVDAAVNLLEQADKWNRIASDEGLGPDDTSTDPTRSAIAAVKALYSGKT